MRPNQPKYYRLAKLLRWLTASILLCQLLFATAVIGEEPEGGTPQTDPDNTKPFDTKVGGLCAGNNSSPGMASYRFHAATVSLNMVDTPLFYNLQRGPSVNFTVTYNQRDANQPSTFPFSNLGPKWTFNWLSFVIDNPQAPSADVKVYMQGGGAETYKNYDPGTGVYGPGLYSQALLGRISATKYVRLLPDGTTETFDKPDSTVGSGRRVFLTRITDRAGNSITFAYDADFRLITVTDAVGQQTTVHYADPPNDRRIVSVEDPFHRVATFEYYADGHLRKITDMGGLTSEFTYGTGLKADFITSLTTPYGTTEFRYDDYSTDPSHLAPRTRWLQATDRLGGIERVEFNERPDIGVPNQLPDPIPCGLYNRNSVMYARNTFFWSKRAMNEVSSSCRSTPSSCGSQDYAKARIFHWLHTSSGWSSGIIESEQEPLEARIWYNYPGQPVCTGSCCPSPYNNATTQEGTSSRPTKAGRVLDDGTTQLYQYEYNLLGNIKKTTDPFGRVTNYVYATNDIDLLKVFQRSRIGEWVDPYDTNQHADKVAEYIYDPAGPPHLPHIFIDADGRATTYEYNSFGQVLSVENARQELTAYAYGDGSSGHPLGYLISITGPVFNGQSPVTSFTYDDAKRVRTVRNDPDAYQRTIDYDSLDRPTQITYPDGTNEQFQYTDVVMGMTLDLTASKDRLDRWTYRHYDANRQMYSITDPLNRTTYFDWCTCGLLENIVDANNNVTRFDYDVQGRVVSKTFDSGREEAQTTTYTYEDKTSRLRSMTDAILQTTHYEYWKDNNLERISYSGAVNPTPDVAYIYDDDYNRLHTVVRPRFDAMSGIINYTYYPVTAAGTLGANRVQTVGGLFPSDTITYSYDELGRTTGQSINGVASNVAYDSLGRLTSSDNALGHFNRAYDGVTSRLRTLSYPNLVTGTYTYFQNDHDRRLQRLQNEARRDEPSRVNLSEFDYTYDSEGAIQTLNKLIGNNETDLSFGYDAAQQLTSVTRADVHFEYGYDNAGNRLSDLFFSPYSQGGNTYTANNLNQLDSVTRDPGPGPALGPFPITYDGNGNMTFDGDRQTYEWDAANRLIAINYTDTGDRTEFVYDGLGRRVMITEYGPALMAKVQPKAGGYVPFSTDEIVLTTGGYELRFEGLNPNGGDNIALLDAVMLNDTLVLNGGFETPVVENSEIAPADSLWDWQGNAGIAANGSDIVGNGLSAPEGQQAAFVGNDASLWQCGSVAPGAYKLSFQAAQAESNETYQQLRVTVRGTLSTKTFVWSGNTIAEERDSTGGNVTKRFFGEGEKRIGGADAGNYYYTRDHLGSVREVTNNVGTLKGQYDYDAWGNSVVVSGSMQVDFGYTGHYFHQPSGLNLAMYRAYSPSLGRWISRDPIGEAGGINVYGYVGDNPVNWVDPLGLQRMMSGCVGNQDFLHDLSGDTDEERRKQIEEQRKLLDATNDMAVDLMVNSVPTREFTGIWWKDETLGHIIRWFVGDIIKDFFIPRYNPPLLSPIPPVLPALPPPWPVPISIPPSSPANPPTPGTHPTPII